MPRISRLRRIAVLGLLALALAGCRTTGESPTPTPGSTPRPFTVMSTDRIRVTDPAAITDTASAMLSLNVFQRLMTADPGQSVLKPDAARDCLFTSSTSYTCTLNEDLAFHNGHPLTSSDVKFSIERAARLNVPGSSTSLLSSLRRIETPDDKTIRFVLSRVDTQFGWALASPTASIVDEESYDADEIQAPKAPIVGSGPFKVVKFAEDQLQLSRYPDYVGRNPARISRTGLSHRPRLGDDRGRDDQRRRRRGLAGAGRRGRHPAEPAGGARARRSRPPRGFNETVLTGTRVLQLHWSRTSPMRGESRSCGRRSPRPCRATGPLISVVPGGVPGHLATFPLGGKVKPKVTWKNRINLTLGYDPSMPNGQDIATQIRTRLENTGGLSVKLRPGEPNADLTWWTARRGRPPRWPGCSPISTPRCPAPPRPSLDRDRVPQDH